MKVLSTIAAVVVLFAAGCGGGAPAPTAVVAPTEPTPTSVSEPTATTEAAAAPTPTEARAADGVGTIGDTLELIGPGGKPSGLMLTLNSVRRSQGNDVYKPDEGSEYVIVNLTVENAAEKPVPIVPGFFYSVHDGAGQKYSMALYSDPNGEGAPGGTIEPGGKKSGDVAFEVPTSAAGLEFVFDMGLGSKPVRFWLGD